MMGNLMAFAESVGVIVIIIGSIFVILFLLCFVWWALGSIWISASNKFRRLSSKSGTGGANNG